MGKPQPRKTDIVPSDNIEDLFYETLEIEEAEKLFVAVCYRGTRYSLQEWVEFTEDPDIKECIESCTVGEIIEIDPDGESEEGTVLIISFGKQQEACFHPSSIRKRSPDTIWV
ncbi:MAG: hypothetical protein A3D44_00900 [Candidatus Staskawiczbacteria bacterium RIFCSPHIGHO2_02_FULL_42_22]|uniref:Uncharacterized protein n=1 Tax=Candidatus Staskawiczbacteria bacterium RIFCSPHIGHO2_02_FULL_42_22 TaxID=1802207 RepID=A0A1G2I427_9BACT|nr:MAG: hypothetical protein A3D44_00900 [Candidatus Staskawiczbacteria bacterium RIFCSPHIGHO2_02_FULL_42_22]